MIYAIRAIGTEYIKIGLANGPQHRLSNLQCGCPFELALEAQADWPDTEERKLHAYLTKAGYHFRREWFKDGPALSRLVEFMKSGDLSGWHDSITKWAIPAAKHRRLGRALAFVPLNG